MYLRRRCRKKNGEEYESWALVETIRTSRGPRQRTVATIGKLPGLDQEERMGWEEIGRVLDGKPRPQPDLFAPDAEAPLWATVDLKRMQIERLRQFGDVYLGLVLWHRLGLADFCNEHMPPGREEIPWSVMAAVLTLARFCSPSSELQIAESWYAKTALDDLLGVPAEKINDDRLYRALDSLLPQTPCASTCRSATASCSGLPSISSSTTSPQATLRGAESATAGQNAGIAETAGLTASRSVSGS